MSHVFTQTTGVDDIYLKGVKSFLRSYGGGQIKLTKNGLEVWANKPSLFVRKYSQLKNK